MEKKSGLLSGAHWRPLGVTPDSGGLLQREETARSESHVSGTTVLLKITSRAQICGRRIDFSINAALTRKEELRTNWCSCSRGGSINALS